MVDMERPQESLDKASFYHISPLRLWVMPGIFLALALMLFAGGSASMLGDAQDDALGLVFSGVLALVGLLLWVLCWYPRIVVDAHGITHRQVGYSFHSGWENVVSVEMAPGALYLVLDRPAGGNAALRGALQVMSGSRNLVPRPDLLAEGRLIDLTPYRWHWERGDLRAKINAYLA
ncbi:MAG: hypothetical protein K0U93_26895 [Gammaproteobacteria bacterium]|nr:hypothetical protein [Gammaproteobacteria bacterium]